MVNYCVRNLRRACHPQPVPEGATPAEEDGAKLYGRGKAERVVAPDAQAGIKAELVQHGVDEGVIRLEGNFAFLAREHSEQLPLVLLNGTQLRQL